MFTASYRIHDFRFALSSHCEELKSGLAQLFPALLTSPRKSCRQWSVEKKRGGNDGSSFYVISDGGSPVYETEDVNALLDDLEWRITSAILRHLGHFVQVHSAGLAKEERALLLVGPSGSGKSSLALALMLRGWRCLSDEIILIDPGSGRILPFPRSFHVHDNTLALIPEIRTAGEAYFDHAGKRRFDPSLVFHNWVAEPAMTEWIVFPDYSPGSNSRLAPTGQTDAVTRLISQSINLVDHVGTGLDILSSLAASVPCLKLSSGDLNEAVSLLTGLTEENRKDVCFSAGIQEGVF